MRYESWIISLEGAERLANIKKQLFTMSGDDAVSAHDMVNAMFLELLSRAHNQIVKGEEE